ncbi:MAG TPA: AfsR/SARP family transcriptional regulator [Gaiellaceae bacterium]|nr:AfsR/SARP family transcriptional regulator [Gaiellaceae bacterium]
MEFRILGPLEVEEGGRPIVLGGPKQRALLTLLLLTPDRPVSVGRLVDALWRDEPPAAAANALQYHVSRLRKTLGHGAEVVTQEPGYLIRIDPEQLDLVRFERLVIEAEGADLERSSRLLAEAIALWRGEPLADLADDVLAQGTIQRLEAARLAALERRVDADLALGRHAQLVPELEAIVRACPLHEGLVGALMKALYGSGRQADALDVYRRTRQTFDTELGIEPSPFLRELERAILRQDLEPSADPMAADGPRSILVLADDVTRFADLLSIAEPLAAGSARELMLVTFTADSDELAGATAALGQQREAIAARGVPCRVAAYTTAEAGAEASLLATEQAVDLVLAEAPSGLPEGGAISEPLATLLLQTPCDVGLLTVGTGAADGPVVTPFGGAEHDWSAIELAAWLASSVGTSLRLLGTEADPALGKRDASRLLARASLLVQQIVGIVTEPLLIPPGDAGVVEAAADAQVLVVGLSDRWRDEGIGPVRAAVATAARAPVLFVRASPRSGGIAPSHTMTRFTWTQAARLSESR